jgi:LmbE family N-acetylglucosaminyl deacetylase
VLPLHLFSPSDTPISLLAIGAHPDDIELGAGGTLLTLAESHPGLRVRYVLLTGTPDRQLEARDAARTFLPGADLTISLYDLPDGRLPAEWGHVKDILEDVAADCSPDLIIGPSPADAHQDHRTVADILPTVFRDSLHFPYELAKWEGDLGHPSVYFPLSADVARRKVAYLNQCFPSQKSRSWWDDEVFLALARLRGVECRAEFAEAFTCTKALVVSPSTSVGANQPRTNG